MFDTSGKSAWEREEIIWKKRNMHWDPKKSHRDTYLPPAEAPDVAYEDNRPIKGLKEDYRNLDENKIGDPFNNDGKEEPPSKKSTIQNSEKSDKKKTVIENAERFIEN